MSQKEKKRNKKFLRNKRTFIFITILSMGIGFAFLSSNLTITGNTSVSGNSWNVYFNNVQVTEGSVDATVAPTTTGTNTTSIDYTVTLDKPGDFYEFTVDAVNAGTIDAMIQSINMTSLDTDVVKYLSYTATYLDGTELTQNDVLEADDSTTYKVRIEFKKNITSDDLSEEDNSLTLTFGVNYVQSTIKPFESKFIKLVKKEALSDVNIDFTQFSSESNGRGLYVMESTKNMDNPIYYYRGSVTNNNALFAGHCWKIVRTTETGGTKLIYNGLPGKAYKTYEKINNSSYINVTNSEIYPFIFNQTTNEWSNSFQTDGEESIITFSVNESGDYKLNYSAEGTIYAEIYKDGEEIGKYEEYEGRTRNSLFLEGITPLNVISVKYSNSFDESSFLFNLEKGAGQSVIGCTNTTGEATQIETESSFNDESGSLGYNGYMYGTEYSTNGKQVKNKNYIYGNNFVYENGTYTLSNIDNKLDSTHHYTCFNETGICSSLFYVYLLNDFAWYLTLLDGKSIDDVLAEMKANTNNSTIKTSVDNWFNNTFKTYFTTNNKDYNDYLEDTVWCNDRSMNTIDTDGTGENISNGWQPNGGSLSNYLRYSSYGRVVTGMPSLTCPNKNDSFTVNDTINGNGALTYPVGLLTADEINLAGGQVYPDTDEAKDNYLYTRKAWWTMSPSVSATVFSIEEYTGFIDFYDLNNYMGVRPSISIKPGVNVAEGGDGSSATPYEFVLE